MSIMTEHSLEPLPMPKTFQVADTLMRPIMYTLGGFKPDSIQETHPWHVQNIDPTLVDPELSTVMKGNSEEKLNSHQLFLFHVPALNGWKHYTLLESAEDEFHIGWISRARGKLAQAAIHRLRIDDGHIRMLNGPGDSEAELFAVDTKGKQIGIKTAGDGVLGDNQFPGVRLF